MKIRVFAVIVFLASTTPLSAQSSRWPALWSPDKPKTSIADVRTQTTEKAPKAHWAWVTSLVVLDGLQVGDVLSSRGGVDANSIIGNNNGKFNTQRAVVLKSVVYGSITGIQIALHHYDHHRTDLPMAATNGLLSGFYTWVVIHNEQIQNSH